MNGTGDITDQNLDNSDTYRRVYQVPLGFDASTLAQYNKAYSNTEQQAGAWAANRTSYLDSVPKLPFTSQSSFNSDTPFINSKAYKVLPSPPESGSEPPISPEQQEANASLQNQHPVYAPLVTEQNHLRSHQLPLYACHQQQSMVEGNPLGQQHPCGHHRSYNVPRSEKFPYPFGLKHVYNPPSIGIQGSLAQPVTTMADRYTQQEICLSAEKHMREHVDDVTYDKQLVQPATTNSDETTRKRKCSLSDDSPSVKLSNIQVKAEPADLDYIDGLDGIGFDDDFKDTRCCANLKWQSNKPETWATLLDQQHNKLKIRVIGEAEKGFTYSSLDEAYVCQKKNHFQIRVTVEVSNVPVYSYTASTGIEQIQQFYVDFHGIKAESSSHVIKVEQSRQDRTKKPFEPVPISLGKDSNTTTVGRLHFSETTNNNMRRKGKPNPDQRFFCLVVTIKAKTSSGDMKTVAATMTEKIIVRASNPGQFDAESDGVWRSSGSADVFTYDNVGIGTNKPDQQLTVHGNIRLTGQMLQPSDQRVKDSIEELDSKEQLERVKNMRIYKYNYVPEYSEMAGMSEDELQDTGILAQDLKAVLPEAVRDTGDVTLSGGEVVNSFLVVNKDRVFMENVGAVKELCKLTDNLEKRIFQLETMNNRIKNIKRCESNRSTVSENTEAEIRSNVTMETNLSNSTKSCSLSDVKIIEDVTRHPAPHTTTGGSTSQSTQKTSSLCSNRVLRISIATMIALMSCCLICITVLYTAEKTRGNDVMDAQLATNFPIESSGELPIFGECSSLQIVREAQSNDCERICACAEADTKQRIPVNPIPYEPDEPDYDVRTTSSMHIVYVNPIRSQSSPQSISYARNRLRRSLYYPPGLTLKSADITEVWMSDWDRTVAYEYPIPLRQCSAPSNCSHPNLIRQGVSLFYSVPVSREFPAAFVRLRLQSLSNSSTVYQCINYNLTLCSDTSASYPAVPASRRPGIVNFTLPIGYFRDAQYNFRAVSSAYTNEQACSLTDRSKFIEYNFKFARYCFTPTVVTPGFKRK